MKGITTIELTNERTGKKQTYKDENMITNYFRDLIQMTESSSIVTGYKESWLNGFERTAQNAINAGTILKVLSSGLVMFDDYLSTDADEYVLPSNVNLVGRGTNVTNSGKDTTLGSFNNASSTISENGAKFVWDFNTDQAVGTIKSICLCPQRGAQLSFGIGNSAVTQRNDTGNDCFNRNYYYVGLPQDQKRKYNFSLPDGLKYYDRENNVLKVLNRQNDNVTSFKLSIYDLPNRNICSLFDNYSCTLKEEKIIQFPKEVTDLLSNSTVSNVSIDLVDDKFIIVFGYYNKSIPVNGTIYYMEIDAKTLEVTTKTVNNTTGSSIFVGNGYLSTQRCFFSTKNYFLFIQGKKIYSCDRKTNEFKEIVLLDEFSESLSSSSEINTSNFSHRGSVVVNDIVIVVSAYKPRCIMIDCALGVMKKFDTWSMVNVEYFLTTNGNYNENTIVQIFDKIFMESAGIISLFPLVLFTKNNLSTPIVKTNEQSMKITYELIKE